MQGIVGDGLLANVLPYGFAFPVCHRVQLYDVAPGRLIELVDLNDPDIRPGFRLLPAQSRDPAIQFAQLILQRKDLSHRAAKVRIALPELRAMNGGLLIHAKIRLKRFDFIAKEILKPFLQLERLGKKQSRIQCEHRKFEIISFRQMHHDQTCSLKAGADGRASSKSFPGPMQNLFGG